MQIDLFDKKQTESRSEVAWAWGVRGLVAWVAGDEGVMKKAGERDYQGAGENFGGDRYVQYIDCSDGFTVSTYVKT